MKISTNSKKRRLIIASSIVAAILFATAGAIFIKNTAQDDETNTQTTSDSSSDEQSVEEQKEAEERIKQDAVEKTDGKEPAADPDSEPADDNKVKVIITVAKLSSDDLVIRALIYDISNKGTCTLKLQRSDDNSVITRAAGVQASASYSTCKGFDIPLSNLPKGDWRITVTYKDSSVEGSAGHSLTIN